MRRFGVIIAVIAAVLAGFGISAMAQHDHAHSAMQESTPDASPMATHATGHSASTSTGAFYLAITNTGDEDDRLVSVETDAAEVVEIHNVEMEGTVMHMMPQHDGIEVPAGEELVLEPGGYHIMLIGLTESLIAGEEFEATLHFEHAGEVEITVPILRTEPDEDELEAEPVEAEDLVIDGIWARHAPKLDGDSATGTPAATPEATPAGTPAS